MSDSGHIPQLAGLEPTGEIVIVAAPSDPGGAAGPETFIPVPVQRVVRWFDERQLCDQVLRHVAGDPLPVVTFGRCPHYDALTGQCALAGRSHPQPCAFLVDPDDPDDDVWARAHDWRLVDLPDLSEPGRTLTVAVRAAGATAQPGSEEDLV